MSYNEPAAHLLSKASDGPGVSAQLKLVCRLAFGPIPFILSAVEGFLFFRSSFTLTLHLDLALNGRGIRIIVQRLKLWGGLCLTILGICDHLGGRSTQLLQEKRMTVTTKMISQVIRESFHRHLSAGVVAQSEIA